MRASIVVAVLGLIARLAAAEPDGVHLRGVVDYGAFVTPPTPALGFGVELAQGDHAVSLDGSLGALPICLFGCDLLYWGTVSASYRYQLTDRIFIGPRIAAVYISTLDRDTMSDLLGWAKVGYAEAGIRKRSGAWIVTVALDAGAALGPGNGVRPALAVRLTLGR